MTIYVLTQREGKTVSVVGGTATESVARLWYLQAPGNDYSTIELDDLTHLGMANGPRYTEVLPLPEKPLNGSPSKYLNSLADYLESVIAQVQA